MVNILISGYYGFDNIGDESILRTLVSSLREHIPDCSLTVLSHNPASTREKYGVEAVDRMSPMAILRAVKQCDMLISGGGSLLQDVTSSKSLHYYLSIIRCAEFFHKKVFIYSQGIGPIDRPGNRRAAAAALNLFEKFGQNDRRFAEIAPQTAISAESSVAQTEKTGTVAASITNAYYDGESLLIGYSIQGFSSFEPFSPTDEQLARMRPTDAVPARLNESHLAEAFEAARQAGTPWGMATYRVAVSDHTYTDDGLDLGPWTETEDASDPDCLLAIRDFDALPETAKNRDSLSLHAAVYQYAVFDYFDGHSMYTTTERTELFPLTATVNRISRDSALFMGFETVKGAKIGLSVQVSEIRLTAKMTAVDGTFPSIPDDSWFDLLLTDEDGEAFSPTSFEILDRQTMCFTFDGNGQMPTTLNASLLIVSPSGQTESIPIVLDVNG